jgi:multidrug efflux pump
MLGVTLFGLFLTPVFYVLLRKLAVRLESRRKPPLQTAHLIEA